MCLDLHRSVAVSEASRRQQCPHEPYWRQPYSIPSDLSPPHRGGILRVIGQKGKSMIHRDQVHGDVRFDPLAVALLNTEALQRLGRVYQLGYAHLIFRGGTHTRLSHVMGASHVAGKLVDIMRQNYADAIDLPNGAIKPEEFLPSGYLPCVFRRVRAIR